MIKLVIDSTCDLPQEMIEKYDIEMLSLRLNIEEKDYADKKDITVEEVFEVMRRGVLPKTSQPSLEDTVRLFESYGQAGEDMIFLSFSSKLSGTYQSAVLVADKMKEKYPNTKFTVIDTKAGSLGIGLIAIETAKLIEQGKSYEEVIKATQFMRDHVRHVFGLTDLEWLVKGGRISRAKGAIGGRLNVKPIIEINDGEMQVIKKARGEKRLFNELISLVEEQTKNYPDQLIGVAYTGTEEFADEVIKLLEKKLGQTNVIKESIGGVLGAHLGLGGVGILFFDEQYKG